MVPGRRVGVAWRSRRRSGFGSGTLPAPGRPARDAGSAADVRPLSIVRSSTCGSERRRNSAISTHSGWVSAPITDRTGLPDPSRLLGARTSTWSRRAARLPKKVSASLIDCVTTPGIRSSSSARHSLPVEATCGPTRTWQTRPSGHRFPYASNTGRRLPRTHRREATTPASGWHSGLVRSLHDEGALRSLCRGDPIRLSRARRGHAARGLRGRFEGGGGGGVGPVTSRGS